VKLLLPLTEYSRRFIGADMMLEVFETNADTDANQK
jgi:hypothetical protein